MPIYINNGMAEKTTQEIYNKLSPSNVTVVSLLDGTMPTYSEWSLLDSSSRLALLSVGDISHKIVVSGSYGSVIPQISGNRLIYNLKPYNRFLYSSFVPTWIGIYVQDSLATEVFSVVGSVGGLASGSFLELETYPPLVGNEITFANMDILVGKQY